VSVRVIEGDCRSVLPTLASGSVQAVVTSPPYYQLRDYGVAGQIGLEESVEAYVAELVAVFREVKRVLRDDGTLWLNLASSYSGGGGFWPDAPSNRAGSLSAKHRGTTAYKGRQPASGFKPKDLIPIPWLVGLALQQDGWWLRRDIIWHKPNCMPESATDRATSAHEYVLMLTKAPRYFYDADAVREQHTAPMRKPGGPKPAKAVGPQDRNGHSQWESNRTTEESYHESGRNMRSVWTIPSAPFPGSHFAVFPPALAERCIRAGTSERGACPACGAPWARVVERPERMDVHREKRDGGHDGRAGNGRDRAIGGQYQRWLDENPAETTGWRPTCSCPERPPVPCVTLDPFAGAGTVALVSDRLGRDSVAVELNPEYVEMIRRRVTNDAPLFADVT
jgi:DNA modification methylase